MWHIFVRNLFGHVNVSKYLYKLVVFFRDKGRSCEQEPDERAHARRREPNSNSTVDRRFWNSRSITTMSRPLVIIPPLHVHGVPLSSRFTIPTFSFPIPSSVSQAPGSSSSVLPSALGTAAWAARAGRDRSGSNHGEHCPWEKRWRGLVSFRAHGAAAGSGEFLFF